MSDFKQAVKILYDLEFNNPKNALHQNKGENGLTFMGIYQSAHQYWSGWEVVKRAIIYNETVEEASEFLYKDDSIRKQVDDFYYYQFWLEMKLGQIESQKIAEEIFIFGVNVSPKIAIKKAQKLIGVKEDGIIGSKTITALNSFCEDDFDMKFDELEKEYYSELIANRPSFKVFENGWNYRAEAV